MNIRFFDTRAAGFLFALISAVTYGLNPFFAIPLYREGLSPLSVLFYRFLTATLLMGGVMLVQKQSFRLARRDWLYTVYGGLLVALTCLFWFMTFHIMDSGVAATLLFIYPVMVVGIMYFCYHERLSTGMVIGIILALIGVVTLCMPGGESKISFWGLLYIFLSSLCFAVYLIMVQRSRLQELRSDVLTFYAMLFSLPVFWAALRFGVDLQRRPSWNAVGNILGLGIFPSVCSFLFAAMAIDRIGPTRTSVLGALEPTTAVLIGVFFFHESLTWLQIGGVVLILVAVSIVICAKKQPAKK